MVFGEQWARLGLARVLLFDVVRLVWRTPRFSGGHKSAIPFLLEHETTL